MREKAIVSWSGGKDSALALYELRDDFEIVALVTTLTAKYDRISMHGVPVGLLESQAQSLGFDLEKVYVSPSCSNDEYESKMRSAFGRYLKAGITSVICGDIFLEDVRRYREEKLFSGGLKGVFPLWKKNSAELAQRFISLGFQAVLCCVDTQALDQEFAGRLYDSDLLAGLPPEVDPCGENGEFHTFVFDGPNMSNAVQWKRGEIVLRDSRFCYCDLLPQQTSSSDRRHVSANS